MPEDTFEHFRRELGQKVQAAQNIGMSQEQIVDQAARIGDWLAQDVAPRTPEQRVLKELWQCADENGQRAIAQAMVKMAAQSPTSAR